MASVVRLLMLVACGPLLLPSGVCVCAAGERVRTAPLDPEPAAPQSCPCSHHHADPDGPPTDPTSVPPDDHCPGCPAITAGVEPQPAGGPTTLAVGAAAPAAFASVPLVSAPAFRPAAPWPSAPPLFLSHCALVI